MTSSSEHLTPIVIAPGERPRLALSSYLDLIYLLVRVEFVSKIKQTALGPVWFVLQPLLMATMFVGVLNKIIHWNAGHTPLLFYLSGLLVWGYFSQALAAVAGCLGSYAPLLRKVYFPRLVLPVSLVAAKLIPFALQLAVFLALFAWLDSGQACRGIAYLPLATTLAIAQAAVAALGIGLWFASLSVRYRDLQHALGYLLQLGLYASPVVYTPAQIPSPYRGLLYLNPVAGPIALLRWDFFATPVPAAGLAISACVALSLLFSGLARFDRIQARFVDIL